MKNIKSILFAVVIGSAFIGCNSNQKNDMDGDTTMTSEESEYYEPEARVEPGNYTNLSTGKTVYIIMDPQTGWAIDSIERVPVEFYTNNAGDTLFQTGVVVNHVLRQADGKWMLDETKVKRDGDKLKIKYPDGSKLKIDGDEMKMKDEDGKIKIDGDSIKVKPNN
ncbi:MAG: hypothetical protein Q8S11_13080 [Daejeonella sp.]|uniref:hypothetical protein n=1 Tax=Daejeonella sp. TaxID=2805397 RepID=UPI002734F2AE|nr:hypothetical protein [Daejeonella sp.]MDP3469266.1 hypothetical protein [Daejeonella sp.]